MSGTLFFPEGRVMENTFSRLVATVIKGLSEDSDIMEQIAGKIDFQDVSLDELWHDEEVRTALKKLMLDVINDYDISEDEDRKNDIWNHGNMDGLIRSLSANDEVIKKAFTDKVRSLIGDEIDNYELEEDDDVDSSISNAVCDWLEDNVYPMLREDAEIKTALADKLRELITDKINEMDEDGLPEKAKSKIASMVMSNEVIEQLLQNDPNLRSEAADKLKEMLEYWLTNLSTESPEIIHILSESPPLLKLVDEAVSNLLKDQKYRDLVKTTIESILQDSDTFSDVISGSLKKIIEVQATTKIEPL
jgi:hypothetical protein